MCRGEVMAIVMGCKCGEGRGVYGARSAPWLFSSIYTHVKSQLYGVMRG